ncbi:MAG TPA: DoxX family protein [Thermoanaerobaculia bacterium]|nr:DoxX family protein [Thermoanaerobaculia bacterium]
MQRLFPAFPRGRPGVGLLLLRATVGLALMVQGGACLTGGNPGSWESVLGVVSVLIGVSLLSGSLTPFAALLAEIVSLGIAFSWLPPSIPDVLGGPPATIFLVVMAAAVLLLGPGGFSLDARWFGRREVVIPPPTHPT